HLQVLDVLGVPHVDERRRSSDRQCHGGYQERRRAPTAVEEPGKERSAQRRTRDEHQLTGTPADPDRFDRQRDEEKQQETEDEPRDRGPPTVATAPSRDEPRGGQREDRTHGAAGGLERRGSRAPRDGEGDRRA